MPDSKPAPETDGAGRSSRDVLPHEALAYALALHQRGQVEAAAEIYRRILAVAPDYVDALHYLGVALHALGPKRDAVPLIQRAIELCPDNADAHNNLGNVLKQQGRLQEAVVAYERALELRPDSPGTLSNLGTLLRVAGRLDDALRVYRQALHIDPQHIETLHNLGNALLAAGDHDGALLSFRHALSLCPYDASSHRRLGAAFYSMGRIAEAAEVYQRWLVVEPDNAEARHLLAATTGQELPGRAPDAFVAQVFDRFAASFDEVLHRLEYKAPQVVAQAVTETVGAPRHDLDILDAGCGTGLGGPLLRPHARRLTGVDLSQRMLAAAAERQIYDELAQGELTAHLEEHPATYDLIASIDTLVYFGDLAPVARAVSGALRANGHLFFTVEQATALEAPLGYRLNPHGRFSQTADYVRRALTEAGLEVLAIRPTELRLERGSPVAGWVAVARKSSGG